MKTIVLALVVCSGVALAGEKGVASTDGLEAAEKDVKALKVTLKQKTPDQLVKEFIPAGQRRFGGYEYYYKYMANIAIRRELESRGRAAESALRAGTSNGTQIWEAINGPGETVGDICKTLLEKLPK